MRDCVVLESSKLFTLFSAFLKNKPFKISNEKHNDQEEMFLLVRPSVCLLKY